MSDSKWTRRALRATAARAFGRRVRVTFVLYPGFVVARETDFKLTRRAFKELLNQGYMQQVEARDGAIVCERSRRYEFNHQTH